MTELLSGVTGAIQRDTRTAPSRRERAAKLGAPDALEFLGPQLPFVAAQLSANQVAQVQKVLDSTVINPDVEKRRGELERRATKTYGSLEVKDEKLERQAWAVAGEKIQLEPSDWRIQLDAKRLLTDDVFEVRALNREEAHFMKIARQVVAERGIWLRLGMGFRIGTDEDGNRVTLPAPEAWLSLGPEGEDAIPAPFGLITRDALMSTRAIVLMHWKMVDQSPRRVRLQAEADRIFNMLQGGQQNHLEDQKNRDTAFPGVPQISDWRGGADFPDPAIWDAPWQLYFNGYGKLTGGDVEPAIPLLAGAALLGKRASMLVHEYEEREMEGAASAVKWLNRAKVAGEVAGAVLAVASGVGALGVLEGGAEAGALGADELAAGRAAASATEDELAEREFAKMCEKDPEFAKYYAEQRARYVPQQKGTVSRGLTTSRPGGQWGVGQGRDKLY